MAGILGGTDAGNFAGDREGIVARWNREWKFAGVETGAGRAKNTKMTIEVGQIWKDKDRRREREGTVRTFIVENASDSLLIECRRVGTPIQELERYSLRRNRFGSGRKNDSLELVSEKEATA